MIRRMSARTARFGGRPALAAAGLLGAMVAAASVPAQAPLPSAAEPSDLVAVYKHLHANPELSYREERTAAYLAAALREAGFEVTERVGDYGIEGRTSFGVVGVLRNGPGPVLMLRTDLDALPVEERTGLEYASTARAVDERGEEVAVMHACGHDLHMTAFLGTARRLSRLRDRWAGTLIMIAQPAEERGAGAKAMLDDGLYERFGRPDWALALHTNAALAAGRLGLVSGWALANVDSVDLTVKGRGGHGAYPHTTLDPVTLSAQIVVNLQTVVSRQVAPVDPAVITVGSIHGGTKHNIIPDEVKLQLTVRSYRPEVREHLLAAIERTAIGTARGAGWPDELLPVMAVKEEEHTPSTYNDPALMELLEGVFTAALGADRVARLEPVMGGEDFSRYAAGGEVPIALVWLGAVDPEKIAAAERDGTQLPSLHSAEFAPLPAPAIETGVTALTAAALDLLARDEADSE